MLFVASAWVGWSLIHCLIVYWLESWLLLPLTLLRIWLHMAHGGDWEPDRIGPDNLWTRLWQLLTFCAGFGLMTYISGILVLGILPSVTGMDRIFDGAIGGMWAMVVTAVSREPAFLLALLVFAVEHLVLILREHHAAGPPETTAYAMVQETMQHQAALLVAVILAAFALIPLFLLAMAGVFGKLAGATLLPVSLLILLKTAVECSLFLRQNKGVDGPHGENRS